MKLYYSIIAALALVSCGGNSDSAKKFSPTDRITVEMTDAERQKAIAAKKAENSVDLNVALNSNAVKLSVMPPFPKGDITEELSERIGVKLLQLTTANGIGGLNNVPGFALCASMSELDKKVTSSAPPKMVAKYEISYSVRNLVTGDVYATCEQEVTGVGGSFEEATRNVVNSIENNVKVQQMLSSASEKIINWYNENVATLKSQVAGAMAENNYAYAMALIASVPEQASVAFEYASSVQEEVLVKFKMQNASNALNAMRQAILASGNTMSTDVYAHMMLIPSDAPEYQEALKLCGEYEANVVAEREKQENRQIAAEEARKMKEHEMELAKIESERILAEHQADATTKTIQKLERELEYERKGFWGSLGSRIIKSIDSL